ncbi:hypothetical protein QYF36_022693 [Acer negundo]|nr:hypothetical protein QYF36_022693 [Acer negundo]
MGLAPNVHVNHPRMTMSTSSGLGTKEGLKANVEEGSNRKDIEGGGTTSSQVSGNRSDENSARLIVVQPSKGGVRSLLAEGSDEKTGTRCSSSKNGGWKRRAINVGVKGKGYVEETQLEKKRMVPSVSMEARVNGKKQKLDFVSSSFEQPSRDQLAVVLDSVGVRIQREKRQALDRNFTTKEVCIALF